MDRAGTWWEASPVEERNRRTAYMLQCRSLQSPMISAFDGPNIQETCPVRGVTTVTPQVFALFNSDFSHQQSQAMARRIVSEVGKDPERQIERAFRLALQRPALPRGNTKVPVLFGRERESARREPRVDPEGDFLCGQRRCGRGSTVSSRIPKIFAGRPLPGAVQHERIRVPGIA